MKLFFRGLIVLLLALPAVTFAKKGDPAAENKKIVTTFYKMVFQDHKVQEAADKYLGPVQATQSSCAGWSKTFYRLLYSAF